MQLNTQMITQPLFRTALVVQKHAPTIAFVGGVAGAITSTVLACRATLALAEELPTMQDELNDVRALNHDGKHKKDVAHIYMKNTMIVTQLYAPSVIIGVASITALTGSHIALSRRNAGLTAAYAAVSEAYDKYRDRVRDEVGKEKEYELYRGVYTEKTKDENGNKVVKKVADPNGLSPYAMFFDERSSEWINNPEMNLLTLKSQQNYYNNLLQVRGHVFLNEVYDALGLPHTSAGSVVGWVIGKDGDNYIDFGIYDASNSLFINGQSHTCLLDFNVDGVIWDKI